VINWFFPHWIPAFWPGNLPIQIWGCKGRGKGLVSQSLERVFSGEQKQGLQLITELIMNSIAHKNTPIRGILLVNFFPYLSKNNLIMRHIIIILLTVFSVACNSCNNAAEVIDHTDTATTTGSDTSVIITTDTGRIQPIINIVKKKSASIAYSYFTTIQRTELKHISAYLSINTPEAKVRDTLRTIERTQRIESKEEDSSIINSLSLPLVYNDVEINLLDPAGDYTITKVGHNNDKQRIDTVKGNIWDWTVMTKSNKKTTKLILKITAYLPNASEELENRSIPIRIKLEQNIVRKLWAALLDDPKYLLSAILLPLIAFFGKRYFDRRKATKENVA
jgi:hypothetical protein